MNASPILDSKSLSFVVPGDLISTNAETIRAELNAILDIAEKTSRQWEIFRLDLTAAKMVDSVGLNLVVGLLKRVQKHGSRLQIVCASLNVLRTFTFTRIDKHVELLKA